MLKEELIRDTMCRYFNELKESLKTILSESSDFNYPYSEEDDKTVKELGSKRMPVLTMRDVNKLKTIRNKKRNEIAQNSVFIPFLYGPTEQSENQGML